MAIAAEGGRHRHGIYYPHSEKGFQGKKDHKQFRVNPLAVAAGMAGLIALDMATTQLFFNVAHTNSTFAEKSLIGQLAMGGGNSVLTPGTLGVEAGHLLFTAGPYLGLKYLAYLNRNQSDETLTKYILKHTPNVLANVYAIGPLTTGIYTDFTNSWNVLHAAGALPTYAPWQDGVNSAMQYYVYDAHIMDLPLEGFMKYWDLADYTGLGLGKFTALNASLALAGGVVARNHYKKTHQKG